MAGKFWLSDRQWAAIAPLLPVNQPGTRRIDDRRVISGIVHMLRNGGRWQDCPACYGPPTTIYNRYHRWSGRGMGWHAGHPGPGHAGRDASDRQHHRQGAPLGRGRKRGATARP